MPCVAPRAANLHLTRANDSRMDLSWNGVSASTAPASERTGTARICARHPPRSRKGASCSIPPAPHASDSALSLNGTNRCASAPSSRCRSCLGRGNRPSHGRAWVEEVVVILRPRGAAALPEPRAAKSTPARAQQRVCPPGQHPPALRRCHPHVSEILCRLPPAPESRVQGPSTTWGSR